MKMKSVLYTLIGTLISFALILQACKKDKENNSTIPPTYTNGQGEIGIIGGTITIEDDNSPLHGTTLVIPEGALSTSQTIEIAEAPANISFPGDSSVQLIRFLPEGLSFEKPITIEIPFSSNDTSKLGIYYYDPETELISAIDKQNIDMSSRTISGLTDHFSYYAAWDEEAGMTFHMFRTAENRIGVRLHVYGFMNNEEGFKYLPTSFRQLMASGELNLWQVLSNDLDYENVYSVFRVYLMEDELIGSDAIDFSHYEIKRGQTYYGGDFWVNIYKKGENEPKYVSGDLFTYDIEENSSNIKNLGRWMDGEPIIFYFDNYPNPDPNKKYFVKASWSLASERTAPPITNFSPIYEFHNKPQKKKISQLPLADLSSIDQNNDKIDDIFQVWNSGEAPDCGFNADQTTINLGQTINFTDQSTNDPTSWYWEFGDGSTSTETNPSYTYSTSGTYSIKLTVENAYGSDTEIKDNYIQVNQSGSAPIASFTATPRSGTAPVTVSFTDESTNTPTSWQWDFGDGGSSNEQNPTHSYNTEGTYTVSLTATNSYGSDTEEKTDYITVSSGGNTPIAEFTANTTSGSAPLTVDFTDQSSNNPTSWQWDFGDGGTSTQQNPSHSYNNNGSYTVILTALNSYGSDVETKTDYIVVSGGGGTGTFTDPRDGQTYNTVEIGNQEWFAENLNYETSNSWWYENNSANGDIYGRLYTWAAAMNGESSSNSVPSGVQGVCPDGWHLPSDAEWTVLTDYLGGESVAGGKMKEAGTAHWNAPNTGATNSSGFTALPGGYRYTYGDFLDLGSSGYWWSATEGSSVDAWRRRLRAGNGIVYRNFTSKGRAFSVRCVRD